MLRSFLEAASAAFHVHDANACLFRRECSRLFGAPSCTTTASCSVGGWRWIRGARPREPAPAVEERRLSGSFVGLGKKATELSYVMTHPLFRMKPSILAATETQMITSNINGRTMRIDVAADTLPIRTEELKA